MSSGTDTLRVLFVEDDENDMILEVSALERAGFVIEHERVEDETELRAALVGARWDVIVSDYMMPTFNGVEALHVARAVAPDIPFILVSGTVGEDVAVEAMRAGADDYVLKQNLSRFAAAVTREVRTAVERRGSALRARWFEVYAESGRTLTASLEVEDVLASIARLITRFVADLCVVDLVDDAGRPRRAAVAHRDPARAAEVTQLAQELPPQWQAPEPGVRAVRERRTLRISDVASLREDWPGSFPAIATRLGAPSLLIVPLIARGHAVGALSLASERRYDDAEVPFAEEVALRAAFAIDNARLFADLQRTVRVRDEFLSIASHELKTPLAVVRLQLSRLDRVLNAIEEGEARSSAQMSVRKASQSAVQLADLVESLIDVTKLSADGMKVTLVRGDLRAPIRAAVETVATAAQRSSSDVRMDLPESAVDAFFDEARIAQLAVNLLSNAIKYGPGKPVEIALRVRADDAVITVADHGFGIASADVDRIFDRFERAVPAANYGGLGLGLYVARTIVDAHGGSIAVRETPGSGATFEVTLPLRGSAAGP